MFSAAENKSFSNLFVLVILTGFCWGLSRSPQSKLPDGLPLSELPPPPSLPLPHVHLQVTAGGDPHRPVQTRPPTRCRPQRLHRWDGGGRSGDGVSGRRDKAVLWRLIWTPGRRVLLLLLLERRLGRFSPLILQRNGTDFKTARCRVKICRKLVSGPWVKRILFPLFSPWDCHYLYCASSSLLMFSLILWILWLFFLSQFQYYSQNFTYVFLETLQLYSRLFIMTLFFCIIIYDIT